MMWERAGTSPGARVCAAAPPAPHIPGGSARPRGTARMLQGGAVAHSRLPLLSACLLQIRPSPPPLSSPGCNAAVPTLRGGLPSTALPGPSPPSTSPPHPGHQGVLGQWALVLPRPLTPPRLVSAQNLAPWVVSGEAALLHPSSPSRPDAPLSPVLSGVLWGFQEGDTDGRGQHPQHPSSIPRWEHPSPRGPAAQPGLGPHPTSAALARHAVGVCHAPRGRPRV